MEKSEMTKPMNEQMTETMTKPMTKSVTKLWLNQQLNQWPNQWPNQIGKYKIRNVFLTIQMTVLFDLEFEFRNLILMEIIPHSPYVSVSLYLQLVVSVSATVSA